MERRQVAGCLAGLAIALIVVGLVSGTILRHIVQIVPIGRPSPVGWRIATFLGFAVLQFVAMWISFTPSIANR